MAERGKIHFTVASELLRELGERLVGRQFIALAELVKNSYDADASKVEISINNNCIEIADHGHGMTFQDFSDRWMRVGSTHKIGEVTSPEFKRPLTGSKGIGRLAVQFLASELTLVSVPKKNRIQSGSMPDQLSVDVNWDSAVQAGELTSAVAEYDVTEPKEVTFPLSRSHGTRITLKSLKQEWDPKEFEELAKEIWFLQPPFRTLTGISNEQADGFDVRLSTPGPDSEALFNSQMSRLLELYKSRIVGKLSPVENPHEEPGKRRIQLSLELERAPAQPYEYEVPVQGDGGFLIDGLEFEIRIFKVQNRLGHGIPVKQAREYMSHWGGIHIYDAGFRIPYAGAAADWLRLEVGHSHRLNRSDLLPQELNVKRGLNHLPTNPRVLGVVHIDTTREVPKPKPR